MKWITRKNVKVDRVACPWLIRRFVDKDAEFIFVDEGSESRILRPATRTGNSPCARQLVQEHCKASCGAS